MSAVEASTDIEAKRELIAQLEESFAILCLEAPIPAALSWSEEQIYAFFESGGEDVPDAPDVHQPPSEPMAAGLSSTSGSHTPAPPAQPQQKQEPLVPPPPKLCLPDPLSHAELRVWFPALPHDASARLRAPRLRLVCFPNAGSAENIFTGFDGMGRNRKLNPLAAWAQETNVELLAIQYPGREGRRQEPPLDELGALAAAIAPALLTALYAHEVVGDAPGDDDGHGRDDAAAFVPYAFVAHSVGTWVQFELMRSAAFAPFVQHRDGVYAPVSVSLSCFPPPDIAQNSRPWASDNRRTLRARAAFQQECGLWDVNDIVFQDSMWKIYEPLLRADFALFDTYHYAAGADDNATFRCFASDEARTQRTTLQLFHGKNDRRISRDHVRGWLRFLCSDSSVDASNEAHRREHCIDGNHLFVYQPVAKAQWARLVTDHVDERLRERFLEQLGAGVQRWCLHVDVGTSGGADTASDHDAEAAWSPGEHEWKMVMSLLPTHEAEACQRFHFPKDQKLAAGSRLLQRALLSRTLRRTWDSVEIKRTREGKPFCPAASLESEERHNFPCFNFNVSHHGRFVAIASEPAALVGLDIMDVQENRDREDKKLLRKTGSMSSGSSAHNSADLASEVRKFVETFTDNLTPGELRTILNGDGSTPGVDPVDEKAAMAVYRRFYKVWTLKEALVKATGQGLGFELKRADFQLNASTSAPSRQYGAELPVATAQAEGTETAVLRLDGVLQRRWRFRFNPLDDTRVLQHGIRHNGHGVGASESKDRDERGGDGGDYRHIACVSRGPPSAALESYRCQLGNGGDLDQKLDAVDSGGGHNGSTGALAHLIHCGISFDDLLALPEPPFRRVTVRELIPTERLGEYDRALALDRAVH